MWGLTSSNDQGGAAYLVTHPPPVRICLTPAEDTELLLWTGQIIAHLVEGHHHHVLLPGADVVLPVDAVGVEVVVVGVGVAVGAVGVGLVIISHISDHFVMRVVVVRVVK